jgi:hypothetical protein
MSHKADCTSSAPPQRLAGCGFCSDRAQNASVNVPAVDGFDLHDPVRFLLNSTTNGRSGLQRPLTEGWAAGFLKGFCDH